MIELLKIKPIHELPVRFEKIDGNWCVIDEGVYEVEGELCCTQNTYNTFLNNSEERERFNNFVSKYIAEDIGQKLMGDYLENTAIKE